MTDELFVALTAVAMARGLTAEESWAVVTECAAEDVVDVRQLMLLVEQRATARAWGPAAPRR